MKLTPHTVHGCVVDPTWKKIVDPVAYAKRLGFHWELDVDQIASPELVAELEGLSVAPA